MMIEDSTSEILLNLFKLLNYDIRYNIVRCLYNEKEKTLNEIQNDLNKNARTILYHIDLLLKNGLLYSSMTLDNDSRVKTIYGITGFAEEFFSNILNSINLSTHSRFPPLIEQKNKDITAFISASFDDEMDTVVDWFRKMSEALKIRIIWLKEIYEARPAEEKIIEHIENCDAFIQILSAEIMENSKEAGWIGNEIAWAYNSKPQKDIAIFVEKGYQSSGIAGTVADNYHFDRLNLRDNAPSIIQYLNDLKMRVEIRKKESQTNASI